MLLARCGLKVVPRLLFSPLVRSGQTFLKRDLCAHPSIYHRWVWSVASRIGVPASKKEDPANIGDTMP
jgi:hypothetical protein